MRVLHFGRFYNDNFGGLERHVVNLLDGLSQNIHVANVVANERCGLDVIDLPRYKVYKAPSLGLLASMPVCPTMPALIRSLEREGRFDLYHLHFPDPMSHLALAALPGARRVVISWHSDIVRQQGLLRLYRPFLNRIIDRAVAIIGATPRHFSASTQLTGSRHPERFHVVPYGLDYAPYLAPGLDAEAARIRHAHDGRPLVFTVGRHVYYKGFEFLIRAMRDTADDALLLLGGTGPLTADYRQLVAELGLEQRVRLLGRIPDAALPAYYRAADVFCMPSVEPSEAFGLVQLEAMACARPVLGCELGNGATFVNQHGITGLVVPPRDPSALAGALDTLLADRDLARRLGEAGRTRALTEFSLEKMWSGTLQVYREVLAS
ncbi:MAG TPA: glycosyltransferase [Burkholderiales bacterium]|nr:glycosyltransferase [Betaproteobacteria bacterium]HQR51644.1 glycosyltransferase [Burkholderiales bacterium]